jgi:putative ATP-binding cassette transporter
MGVIRDFVRLALPYFRSDERRRAGALLAAVVVIELVQVAVTVQFNLWNRRFFDALQMRQLDTWLHELGVFLLLGCAMVAAGLLILVANQTLLILWRRWMTQRYLGRWLASGNHYRLMVGGQAIDNPDQRISMDVASFLTQSLTITIGLLRTLTTLASFVFILWQLSSTPLPINGRNYAFPGFLVIAAFFYALVGTLLTHLVGRQLVRLNFMQERFEADFRFDLVRVREHSEQIALLKGEPAGSRSSCRRC